MSAKKIKASRIFNRILKLLLGKYLTHVFNIEFIDENGFRKLEPPYIILSNHTNLWDPFILSIFVPEPVHFGASFFYFRNFFVRQLLKLVGAIPKTKSISDMETVKAVLRVRNDKRVIGVYPEGARNWDGKTLELLYPTAKLIKTLKIPVVSALMKGAYLSLPRWAKKRRKGKMTVSYRITLEPDTISQMTVDEIYSVISQSLDFDEYAFQQENMIPFKGRRLAERLELFLFICPHCKTIGMLRSRNNLFSCSNCNYTVRYDAYGFLQQVTDPQYFKIPGDWNKWQLGHLKEVISGIMNEGAGKPIFEDSRVILSRGNKRIPLKKLHIGHMLLYNDRIRYTSLAGKTYLFNIESIQGINVQSNRLFEFYYEKILYRFNFEINHVSAYKWVEAIKIINKNKYKSEVKGI